MIRRLASPFLAQIESASASLYRRCDASAFSFSMRRFRIALGSGGGLLKSRKPQRIDPKRKAVAPLSAKAEKHSAPQRAKTELRIVPGVGPKNEQLLCQNGIVSLAGLRSVFSEKFDEKDTLFIQYLREEIGIRNSGHCRSIAGYLKESPETAPIADQDRITLSLEGNISAGKTTILKWLADEQVGIQDMCEVVPEPIEEWLRVGGREENNLLERFYREPKNNAYIFQNYVFFTRMDVNRRTFSGPKPLRLTERSVFSDRLVFVRAVHESNWMDDCQLQMYDNWFSPMIRETPGLIPDGFIYLRAEPDTCMKRLRQRNRAEEITMSNAYLEGLHEKHEDWFKQEPALLETTLYKTERKVLIPGECEDPFPVPEIEIPSELEGSIIWLGQSGILGPDGGEQNGKSPSLVIPATVKSAVSRIPALVLDCNADVDVENNLDAKREHAKKVKIYYDFVRQCNQRQRRFRRFYESAKAEDLRRKWQLVDTLTESDIRMMQRIKRDQEMERMKVEA